MSDLDFKGLAGFLLGDARRVVAELLPGGKLEGNEWVCSSIHGGAGGSFSVNKKTGKWGEFDGTGKSGLDLISLYAAQQGINNPEAFKALAERYGYSTTTPATRFEGPKEARITAPPINAPVPGRGSSGLWCYRNERGEPLFYVARYETPNGKVIRPWSWDANQGKWIAKGYPDPRPLYGLEILAGSTRPVLVVEGEKKCEAARTLAGHVYDVVAWPNGVQAIHKTDWNPLRGRKLLLWPDADRHVDKVTGQVKPYEEQPGPLAMAKIAALHVEQCPEIKTINVGIDLERKDGWDAADALAEGWDWERFKAWAVPRLELAGQPKPMLPVPAPAPEAPVETVQATAIARTETVAAAAQARVDIHVDSDAPEGISGASYAEWARLGVAVTKAGGPICNVDNALRVLENREEFKHLLWFDEFHTKYFTKFDFQSWQFTDTVREWADIDELHLTAFLQRQLGFTKLSDDIVHKSAQLYARQHIRNEPRDWMDTLAWDGENRCEAFFPAYFGAELNEYTMAVSKNFWISLIARVYRPGCQVDNMVILEGLQGTYKSRALEAIGGTWFAECKESVMTKDFYMVFQGKLIVAINELASFTKAEIQTIKSIVTSRTDRYRPPYGRSVADFPRRCVFMATTNDRDYLRDDTGGRRFWPIRTGVKGNIKLSMILEHREQLFAEAVHRFKSGESWYEMPKKDTEEEQESRRQADPWESLIVDYIVERSEVRAETIALDCLNVEKARLKRDDTVRIGRVLRRLGWEDRTVREGAKTEKVFFRPEF